MFNLFKKAFTASQARELSTRPTAISLDKLKQSVYEAIKTAATHGLNEATFKFSKEVTINQVRQIQVALGKDGYKFTTEFYYLPTDVVKTQEGVLSLSSLNDYAGFSSAKITIFW